MLQRGDKDGKYCISILNFIGLYSGGSRERAYLPTQPIHVYGIIPPPPPKTSSVTWQANMDWDDECQVIHEFSVVKCCFCHLNIF